MEVHARYTVMGVFTLAVVAAGFWFVYWLETGGGLGKRIVYRVEFAGPVAGLSKGASVLFNGVRVGEVTSLVLDAGRPNDVTVAIAVDAATPVRADTKAGIEFQGLAGAPTLALSGGSPGLPMLAAAAEDARRLIADRQAGQSLSEAARDLVRRLDVVVAENAKPLRSAIDNIDQFSAALARNAGKVDGIVAGLERLTGGGSKAPIRIVELTAARSFPSIPSLPTGQLLVPEPTALAFLEGERILVEGGDKGSRLENAQWSDMLPRAVQAGVVRSFENAGYKRAIARAPEGVRTDYQLLLDIRRFHIVAGPATQVEIELAARILKADGSIGDVRTLKARAAAGGPEPEQASRALAEAFAGIAAELVAWACAAL